MHRNVEVLIGRLATDPELARRFSVRPHDVMREQRLDLTDVERDALAAIGPEAFRAFTAALDARLRRAAPAADQTDEKESPR